MIIQNAHRGTVRAAPTSQAKTPMLSASYDLGIGAARAEALFASALQRSGEPSARQVRQAVAAAIRAYGDLGCAARVAQAYGERPELAVTRMRWARMAVAGAFGGSRPAHPRAWPGRRPPRLPVPPDRDSAAEAGAAAAAAKPHMTHRKDRPCH